MAEGVALVTGHIPSSHHNDHPFILAIDGRCASGKTTLAVQIANIYSCPVIHMDDFFLPPSKRTSERLAETGGNLDRERFAEQVLQPLTKGVSFAYAPYDCHTQSYGTLIHIPKSPMVVIEGSYACHPELAWAYDLKLFMTITPELQNCRIMLRNGIDAAKIFREKWIPMEEAYFNGLDIPQKCDMIFEVCPG